MSRRCYDIMYENRHLDVLNGLMMFSTFRRLSLQIVLGVLLTATMHFCCD